MANTETQHDSTKDQLLHIDPLDKAVLQQIANDLENEIVGTGKVDPKETLLRQGLKIREEGTGVFVLESRGSETKFRIEDMKVLGGKRQVLSLLGSSGENIRTYNAFDFSAMSIFDSKENAKSLLILANKMNKAFSEAVRLYGRKQDIENPFQGLSAFGNAQAGQSTENEIYIPDGEKKRIVMSLSVEDTILLNRSDIIKSLNTKWTRYRGLEIEANRQK